MITQINLPNLKVYWTPYAMLNLWFGRGLRVAYVIRNMSWLLTHRVTSIEELTSRIIIIVNDLLLDLDN